MQQYTSLDFNTLLALNADIAESEVLIFNRWVVETNRLFQQLELGKLPLYAYMDNYPTMPIAEAPDGLVNILTADLTPLQQELEILAKNPGGDVGLRLLASITQLSPNIYPKLRLPTFIPRNVEDEGEMDELQSSANVGGGEFAKIYNSNRSFHPIQEISACIGYDSILERAMNLWGVPAKQISAAFSAKYGIPIEKVMIIRHQTNKPGLVIKLMGEIEDIALEQTTVGRQVRQENLDDWNYLDHQTRRDIIYKRIYAEDTEEKTLVELERIRLILQEEFARFYFDLSWEEFNHKYNNLVQILRKNSIQICINLAKALGLSLFLYLPLYGQDIRTEEDVLQGLPTGANILEDMTKKILRGDEEDHYASIETIGVLYRNTSTN